MNHIQNHCKKRPIWQELSSSQRGTNHHYATGERKYMQLQSRYRVDIQKRTEQNNSEC